MILDYIVSGYVIMNILGAVGDLVHHHWGKRKPPISMSEYNHYEP